MPDIGEYEAHLLADGQVNYHVRRRNNVLLSLPASRLGAARAIRLYQPQRKVARLVAWSARLLVDQGLHRGIFRRGKPMERESAVAWDFEYSPETVGILLGSAEHLVPRAIASYHGCSGWEVAKLGRGPEVRATFQREAEILSEIASRGMSAPRCLGLHEQGDMTLLRMPYLQGRSVAKGDSDSALDLLHGWLGCAPPKAICEFREWHAIRSAMEASKAGLKALETFSGHWIQPVISHGDFARWNLLLLDDGSLTALDWEWGIIDGMPGVDLVHYFAQDFRLVQGMNSKDVIRAVENELIKPRAREYLGKTGWGDCLIEPILASVAYKQGARHQKNPELLAACIDEYLVRQRMSHQPREHSAATRQATTFSGSGSLRVPNPTERPGLDLAKPRLSIITPSLKQVEYLKCCAASVRDQVGDFELEHLIFDGGSGREFEQWAVEQQGAVCVSAKDEGMYDAINRGFHKAKGDIVAWLNCDEQYLPGALQRVARYFAEHPEIDILFGDVVLVDEVMIPLAYRRAIVPKVEHIRHSHLSTFSAATFLRRRVLDDGHFLQTRWKAIADAVWIHELITAGYRSATLPEPIAIFGMLGSNLGQSDTLLKEQIMWEEESGVASRWRRPWYVGLHRLRRMLKGAYWMRKVVVDVYIPGHQARDERAGWTSGRWKMAKDMAESSRTDRDGTLSALVQRVRRSRWTLVQASCAIILSIFMDALLPGDAVKGPFILLLSLWYLSFRSKFRDLFWITIMYFLTAWYVLHEQERDVFTVRLMTFTIGAIMGLFWAASLRNLEEWIRSTVALIRKIPLPMILTDRYGKVILINLEVCKRWRGIETRLLHQKLCPLALESEGNEQQPLSMLEWQARPPIDLVGLVLGEDIHAPLARARVFVVGRGRFRVYAFKLKDEDTSDIQSLR